jgi:hypothetical protein
VERIRQALLAHPRSRGQKKATGLKWRKKKLIQTIGIQFYALVVLESEKLKYHFRKLESKSKL